MAVHKTSRSGLFLLELMIVILFFAVTSAVCVNLFVQAHLTSTAGGELTAATREVQSAAEWLKAADGDLESWRPSWMQSRGWQIGSVFRRRLEPHRRAGCDLHRNSALRRPTHGAARRRRDCSGPNRPGGLFFSGGCGLE